MSMDEKHLANRSWEGPKMLRVMRLLNAEGTSVHFGA
jgi:hypothetical protein